MAQEGSVAPKERVNIVYKSESGGMTEDKELPLKLLVMGDFTGRADSTPVGERKTVNVNNNNFDDVLRSQNLSLQTTAPNTLAPEGGDMSVNLKFNSLKDFEPEAVANQVPELKKLLELRQALTALKGPLGNVPEFRKKIEAIIKDQAARDRILKEIGGDKKA